MLTGCHVCDLLGANYLERNHLCVCCVKGSCTDEAGNVWSFLNEVFVSTSVIEQSKEQTCDWSTVTGVDVINTTPVLKSWFLKLL